MCLQAPLAAFSGDGNSYFWTDLPDTEIPTGQSNTRSFHRDPQQAGRGSHPELPFMPENRSLHLSAQTIARESIRLLFAGRWVFVFLF